MSVFKFIKKANKLDKNDIWHNSELDGELIEIIAVNDDAQEVEVAIPTNKKMEELQNLISKYYLIRQTKNAMMQNQDCYMWSFCDGDLDNADETTVFKCLNEDNIALGVAENYIDNLINAIQYAKVVLRSENITIKVYLKGYSYYIKEQIERKLKINVEVI